MSQVKEQSYLSGLLINVYNKQREQAGAELCQAHFKLGLIKVLPYQQVCQLWEITVDTPYHLCSHTPIPAFLSSTVLCQAQSELGLANCFLASYARLLPSQLC